MAGLLAIFPIPGQWCRCLPLIVCLFSCNGLLCAQEIDYRAQSLFIYKFTRYVTWPQEKQTGDFRIGVYGNSDIFQELQIMASLKLGGKDQTINVIQIEYGSELHSYHIIYVASSKSRDIASISNETETHPVLLVAERNGLVRKGAVVSFLVMDDGSLRFEFNVELLNQRNLRIADDLLKLGFPM